MNAKLVQPIDGSAAFIQDERGRKLYFPSPVTEPEGANEESVLGASGESMTFGVLSEELTLSTGGLTSDSTANLLPAASEILGVVARVTEAITVTTNWAVGDPTSAARFSAANATKTLGTTSVGVDHRQPTVASAALGPCQTAAAKVRITCTGSNPGAGKVRVSVFYRAYVAPTS